MKILLDTHAIIWALTGDARLKPENEKRILNPDNSVYFSTASLWEIAIKNGKAPEKCPYSERDIYEKCIASGYELLDVHPEDIFAVRTLRVKKDHSLLNMDPFDRLLLAQAKAEKMRLLSADRNFDNYDEACLLSIK